MIGRYQVIERLGQGGTCRVFKVLDPESQQIRALKVLLDNSNVLRFKREYRSMVRLDHPNIAKVYDYGESGDDIYFTMEFISGGDLKQWLKRSRQKRQERAFPEKEHEFREIVDLFCRISDPLQYIHLQHIVHRDLKPANIMLTEDNTIKLMDFGLVKETDLIEDALTKTGMFIGTVAYMSPEQGMGRHLDHRTDLYSLGVILYEACTGQIPFHGDNVLNIFMQHIRDNPVPPRKVNPAIPIPLERIILKLLQKQPIERFNSAAELVAELHAVFSIDELETSVDRSIRTLLETRNETIKITDTRPVLLVPGIIGRDIELKLLRDRMDHLLAQGGGVVLIQGEAGMGKSALMQEIASGARFRKFSVLRSACSEVERYPFNAFVPALNAVAEKLISAPESEIHRLLQGRGEVLASFCPGFLDIPAMKGRPLPAQLEPAQHKIRAFDAVKTLLVQYSSDRPVVLFIDDFHWADELSFELLHYLARVLCGTDRTSIHPLLIVVGYQKNELSEEASFWKHHERILSFSDCEEILLPPLDIQSTRKMILSMLGTGEVTSDLHDRVYRESGGNPFYIEEIMRGLLDDDSLCLVRGKWLIEYSTGEVTISNRGDGKSGSLTKKIPDRLRRMIVRRMMGMSEKTRDVLSRAAVIGGQFEFDMLQTLCEITEDELLDHLDEAMRLNVIEDAPGLVGKSLRFTQNLISKVLYEDLSALRRNRLHLKTAETILALRGSGNEANFEILAYHFDRAQRLPSAIEYYSKAARYAIQNSVVSVALADANRILELLPQARLSQEQRSSFQLVAFGIRGECFDLTGNIESAMKDYQRLIDLSRSISDQRNEAKGLYSIGRMYVKMGNHDGAMDVFKQSLTLIEDIKGNASEKAFVKANIALVWLNLGETQTALDLFRDLSQQTQNLDPPVAAMCDSNIGLAYYYLGDYTRALESLQRAITRFQSLNEPNQILKVMNNIAGIHMARGDTDKVLSTNLQSLALARKIADVHSTAIILGNLALIYQEQGDHVLASESYKESLDISRNIGDRVGIAIALINVGNMMMDLGNDKIPDQNFTKAYEIANETGERWIGAIAMHLMAEFCIARKNLNRAETILGTCLDEVRQIGLRSIEVQARANLSYIKAFRDRSTEALDQGFSALDDAKKAGDADAILRTQWRLSSICMLFDMFVDARRIAVEGLRQASRRQYRIFEWRFLVLIGDTLIASGNPRAALRAFLRGAYTLDYISDNTAPDDRKMFLKQPEISNGLNRLKQLAESESHSTALDLSAKLLNMSA